MKEIEFQGWVLDVAARFGWRVWHVPTPMRAIGAGEFVPETRAAGLPDLIMFHEDPARLIFAELKGKTGKLSDAQGEFLLLAMRVADASDGEERQIGVYVWRPGDEEQVETVLRSKVMA